MNITKQIINFNKQPLLRKSSSQRKLSSYTDQCKADRSQSLQKTQDTYNLLYTQLPTAQLKSEFDTIKQTEQPVDDYAALDLMFKFWIDNYSATGFTSENQAYIFFSSPGNLAPNEPCMDMNTTSPTIFSTPMPTAFTASPVVSPTISPTVLSTAAQLNCFIQPVELKNPCLEIVSLKEVSVKALDTYNIEFGIPNSDDLTTIFNSLESSPSSMSALYDGFHKDAIMVGQSSVYSFLPNNCQGSFDSLSDLNTTSTYSDMKQFMELCDTPVQEAFVSLSTKSSSSTEMPLGYKGIEVFELSTAALFLLFLARRVALKHTKSYRPLEKQAIEKIKEGKETCASYLTLNSLQKGFSNIGTLCMNGLTEWARYSPIGIPAPQVNQV